MCDSIVLLRTFSICVFVQGECGSFFCVLAVLAMASASARWLEQLRLDVLAQDASGYPASSFTPWPLLLENLVKAKKLSF